MVWWWLPGVLPALLDVTCRCLAAAHRFQLCFLVFNTTGVQAPAEPWDTSAGSEELPSKGNVSLCPVWCSSGTLHWLNFICVTAKWNLTCCQGTLEIVMP